MRSSIRRLVSNHMIDRRSENVTVEEGDRRTWELAGQLVQIDSSDPGAYESQIEQWIYEWLTKEIEEKAGALKNRIELVTDIPQELEEFKVIKFFLQPLAENAVLHGMGEAAHGTIWVAAEQYGERVCVTVQDNGVGMEQGKLDEILKEMDENSKKRHVTGIGLTSIHELMKVRYGPDYGLYIESRVGYGTKVFAVFPYRRGSGTC